MASTARIDELKKKFDENPRRYFAPLANEFRKAGDIEQAIVICEEFLPQQPGHMSGHIVYGQALYEAGKLPESRGVFETALGLDPENLIALRHLGDIARDQGDHGSARGWYARVLDADPRNDEIQAVIAGLDSTFTMVPDDTAASVQTSRFEPPPLPLPPVEMPRAEPERLDLESFGAPPPIPADLSLGDTQPAGVPVIPTGSHYTPESPATTIVEGFSAHSFEQEPETASLISGAAPRADGLESTAFMAPDEPVATANDLDSSLESGVPSFSAPEVPVETLAGLQGSDGDAYQEPAADESLPPLDLDDGLVLPPQGDPVAAAARADDDEEDALRHAHDGDDLLEFEMPGEPAAQFVAATEVAPEAHEPAVALFDAIPVELPPAVIAAEAELIEAGESPAPAAEMEMDADEAPVAHPPFVTETMAELYLAQGYRDRARDVYAQLSAANPSDERLRGLVDSLAPDEAAESSGPTVRDFFARLAARRPANRAAAIVPPAADDFAPLAYASEGIVPPDEMPYSVAEAEDLSTDAQVADAPASADEFELAEEPEHSPEVVATALERAAKMRTPNGSIDALFGNRVPGKSEDSAASALAQAFGGVTEGPLPSLGRPAHAAAGELSLDSVFRDGPARPQRSSQSFSFDQFFTGSASRASSRTSSGVPSRPSEELATPGEPPAEKTADDIEQFNSWLQGLKPR